MKKRILICMALGTSILVVGVGAQVAGATPVESQYAKPPVTNPPPKVEGKTAVSVAKPAKAKPAVATPVATKVTAVASTGTLPFTGLNLTLFLAIGGIATLSGLGLRRVAARRSSDQ